MANLSFAQLATLQADILADPAFALVPMTADGAQAIANAYNDLATPAANLWRPDIGVDEAKKAIVWVDYAALSPNGTAKQNTYLALTQGGVLDATVQGIRDAFTTIFGGGSASLTALVALAKRPASRAELLFATGPVSGAYITAIYGQQLTYQDVQAARTLS